MQMHFWYSESVEERQYENFASAMESGHLSSWDIPRWSACRVAIGGEPVELHYSMCSDRQDSYESVADRVYLGEGEIASCRSMKLREIQQRMQELGMIIPSALGRA